MRTTLRAITSLLIALALWTSSSAAPRAALAADRFIGVSHAAAVAAHGLPSAVLRVARAAAHVSHPVPVFSPASCAAAFARTAAPVGHQQPATDAGTICRSVALAFPYDATAPPSPSEH